MSEKMQTTPDVYDICALDTFSVMQLMRELKASQDPSDQAFARECLEELKRRKS